MANKNGKCPYCNYTVPTYVSCHIDNGMLNALALNVLNGVISEKEAYQKIDERGEELLVLIANTACKKCGIATTKNREAIDDYTRHHKACFNSLLNDTREVFCPKCGVCIRLKKAKQKCPVCGTKIDLFKEEDKK